ncbi:unnamed protein product [Rotaria sp. Silwood1]|nr:unnamed protein product [Rotaria sp. Silwood1]
MAFICRNIDNASQLKFWPDVMFSSPVERYINELGDVHSIHPDSLAIVLVNLVAATLEFSYVLRANSISNKIPTNLFNLIVARSSYGKSDLTRLLRDMLKTVVLHRPTKFLSTSQIAVGSQVNASLDEMSKAGLMSGLDECCRTVICDEADMTFADVGLFLSNNACLMTLFDRVSHAYIRQLANRSVSGCSTGDIISNMIIRMKSGACFDPAIGRFIFWPLDGPVIPDKLMQRQIDNNLSASLHQFVVTLSFVENAIFSFEDDAIAEMITWGNMCKQRSFDERNTNESLSARLGKAVQHVYRMASFLQTIEIGFDICQDYIEHYQHFPTDGTINADFIDNISDLFHLKYPCQFRLHEPDPFQISKDVALRAIDLISCNMRQFIMLFDNTYAPKVSSIGRQVIVLSPDQQKSSSDDPSSIQHKEFMNLKLFVHTAQNNDFGENDIEETIVTMSSSYTNQSNKCSSHIPLQVEENLFDNLNFFDEEQNEHSNYINIHHEKQNKNLSNVGVCEAIENISLIDVNIFHEEQNYDMHSADTSDVQENINLNNINIFHQEQNNDIHMFDVPDVEENINLNNINICHQESNNDLNQSDGSDVDKNINLTTGSINHHEKNDDLNRFDVSSIEEDIISNDTNIRNKKKRNHLNNIFSSPAAWRTRSKSKTATVMDQEISMLIFLFHINNP